VRGYEVVTSDQRVVGRVADIRDGYLIVEAGRLHKSRRPVPREFIHAVDQAAKVFVTVPRRVLRDAPEVDRKGWFDREAAARHYGLASSYEQAEYAPEHKRAEIRKHMRPGPPVDQRHGAPAPFGDRRVEEARIRE
jgi:hypothetical protein